MKEMKELKNSLDIKKGSEGGRQSDSRMRISALGLRQVNGTETDAERRRRVMQIVCKLEEGSSST